MMYCDKNDISGKPLRLWSGKVVAYGFCKRRKVISGQTRRVYKPAGKRRPIPRSLICNPVSLSCKAHDLI